MQALIEELMKENQESFLHLNCGLETVTTSAEMAEALRARASKLPAALGIALRSIPMVSSLTPLLGVSTQVDKDALAAPSNVYEQISDLMSESKDNNLTYVLNCYKKVLLEDTAKQKPVFIIGKVSLRLLAPLAAPLVVLYFFLFSLFFLPPLFLNP